MPTRSLWQVSSGSVNRNYAQTLLKCGVALIGPGDAGAWTSERDADFDGEVRRFAAEVRIGDAVLLRGGLSSILAIGLVASDYLYLQQFADVNGLDLEHARRVRWFALNEAYEFPDRVFGAGASRFSRVNHPALLDYADRFVNSPPDYWKTAKLPALPAEEPALDTVPEVLKDLHAQVQDLFSLYSDRSAFGDHPTEDELLAHYVIPFLRALGWPVERIAVKWRFVDVTLFKRLPRVPENVHLIIEAKRLGDGVEGALAQAQSYLQALAIQRDIVVTDGIRYRMYAADRNFAPVAYANLARLKVSALDLFARIARP